jgi:signal transduction histidine kinase/ligand-binding sensor domain-containing protein/CheY-like chemotaxis protein
MSALAQVPYLSFGHNDGDRILANVDIVDIDQDSQGFLWFATLGNGLVRYDGYEFRTFVSEPNNPSSLSHNDVLDINIDAAGQMWASTASGTNRYDPATETFALVVDDQGLTGIFVTATATDSNGTLWINGNSPDGSLLRKDKNSGSFLSYWLAPDVAPWTQDAYMPFFAECLFVDSSDTVWVGTLGGGLLRYERTTDSFTRFLHDPDDAGSIADNHVTHIYEDSRGTLWVSTDGGLSRKESNSNQFRTYFPKNVGRVDRPTKIVGPVLEDSYGNFWVAINDEGVYILDRATGSHVQFSHDPSNPRSLASNSVSSIFEDRSGVIWFGSTTVSRLAPGVHAFSEIRNPANYPGTRARVADSMIQTRDGTIWMDGAEGVDRYDPATGEWLRQTAFADSSGNGNNEVIGIHEDSSGEVWLAHPNHVSRIDPMDGSQISIEVPFPPNSILKDQSEKVWLGMPTGDGLYQVNIEDRTVSRVPYTEPHLQKADDPAADNSRQGFLSHLSIRFVDQDRAGRIWIGTYAGLNRQDPETGRFVHYRPTDFDESTISSNNVTAFLEDSNGGIWFGSANGINRYQPTTDSFQRYYLGSAAKDNRINDIVQGENDRLWLNNGNGIAELDPETGAYRQFDTTDGMPGLIGNSILRGTHDGLIYMATPSGLVSMNPDKIEPTSTMPAVVLTDFRIHNRPVSISESDNRSLLSSSITTTRDVTLRPEHSIVSFGFSALDFVNPDENQYAYQLDGFDDDWIETDADRRIASYTNLPPGNYEFRVKAANSVGHWNDAGAVINLTVLPPWFRTQWAYLCYAILVIAFITGLVNFRTRTLRIRGRELEQLVNARTAELETQKATIEKQALNLEELIATKNRYFTHVSHEFRTPLTVILGPIDRLVAQLSDIGARQYLRSVQRNGSRLLHLVDQLLGLTRLESDHSEPAAVHPVRSTVLDIVASFESYAKDKQITLSTEAVEDVWVQSADDVVEEIVINLLSNALKYTPSGGKVDLSATREDNFVCLSVADNGPGIAADQQERIFERFFRGDDLDESIPGSGLGLALVKELVSANNGEISVDSQEGGGTTFRVLLPTAEAPGASFREREMSASASAVIETAVASLADTQPIAQSRSDDSMPSMLVIEDNLDLCRHLEHLFGKNLNCSFAHDGRAGLDAALAEIPDVIICDAMLPKINGFEITRHLKHDDRTSHIPIIMLTARVDDESRLRGLRALADDYVTKPFNEAELRQRVETVLAVREILRLRYAREAHQIGSDKFTATMCERDRKFIDRVDEALSRHFADPHYSTSRKESSRRS